MTTSRTQPVKCPDCRVRPQVRTASLGRALFFTVSCPMCHALCHGGTRDLAVGNWNAAHTPTDQMGGSDVV